MPKSATALPFVPFSVADTAFPVREFKCGDYPSIQAAVDACAAAGGGTVRVSAGQWQTGPLHLSSRIHLHLDKGAVVRFSDRPADYLPVVFTRWEGTECYNYSPLLYARGCEDVAVTGEGVFDGSGAAWWSWKKKQQLAADALYKMAADGVPVEQRVFGTEEAALRPSFLQFIDCTRVRIEGVTFCDGPQWTLHPVYCTDVAICGVHIRTNGPNTDGLNPDSCKNVLIENSDFSTGDDCIAINAGINEDGWRVGRPCENIEVRNCTMTGGHGAVTIGSAVSGGVRNVYFHDCRIADTMQGIRLKSMRGRGGAIENAVFENIDIQNTTNEAVQINMFYESSTVIPRTNAPTSVKNVILRNVQAAHCAQGILLRGLPEEPLRLLTLEHIHLNDCGGVVMSAVASLEIQDVTAE